MVTHPAVYGHLSGDKSTLIVKGKTEGGGADSLIRFKFSQSLH